MTDAEQQPANPAPAPRPLSPWLPWLAWGWVGLLFLAALAEVTGWADLRLALDFQRYFH